MRPSWTEEDCSTEKKKERAGSSENKMAARAAKTPRKEPKDVFFFTKQLGMEGFLAVESGRNLLIVMQRWARVI